MKSLYTLKQVENAILRIFKDYPAKEVLSMLKSYGTEEHEKEVNRVYLAILKLSQGDIVNLKKYLGLAKKDYRDVLVKAEYNNNLIELQSPYKDIID